MRVVVEDTPAADLSPGDVIGLDRVASGRVCAYEVHGMDPSWDPVGETYLLLSLWRRPGRVWHALPASQAVPTYVPLAPESSDG